METCIFPAGVFLTRGLITSYGGVASRYFAAGAISCTGTKQTITAELLEFPPEAQKYAALPILGPAKDGDWPAHVLELPQSQDDLRKARQSGRPFKA